MNNSLLGFFQLLAEKEELVGTFGGFFTVVGDSMLTTLLLCFMARWVLKICIDLGRSIK